MSITILIADDHKLMREGIRSLITEHADMSVIGEAEDGETAVRMAVALSPDIILMDISMPGLSGIEATRRILANGTRSRVIALSMSIEKNVVLNMLNTGASGYLLKDCAFEEVVHAIRAVAASSEVYLSPKITSVLLNNTAALAADDAGIEGRRTDTEGTRNPATPGRGEKHEGDRVPSLVQRQIRGILSKTNHEKALHRQHF